MILDFSYTAGIKESVLIDYLSQKIYYIPNEHYSNLEDVLKENTNYDLENLERNQVDYANSSIIEIVEFEFSKEYIDDVINLCLKNLTDYLVIYLKKEELDDVITFFENSNKIMLRNIYLVIEDDNEIEEYKGLFTIVSYNYLVSQRKVTMDNLVIDKKLYIESLQYNTFYNRRLYVCSQGKVKNFKEQSDYVDINEIIPSLDFFLNNKTLSKLWKVDKSKIVQCKMCKYRNMCIDSDTLKKVNDDLYEKTTTCFYTN